MHTVSSNAGNVQNYETCAKLHKFNILFISLLVCISLIKLYLFVCKLHVLCIDITRILVIFYEHRCSYIFVICICIMFMFIECCFCMYFA